MLNFLPTDNLNMSIFSLNAFYKRICFLNIISLFLFGSPAFSQMYGIRPHTHNNGAENFAKIKLGGDLQNGTGSVVGADNKYIYILTALHCCILNEEVQISHEDVQLSVFLAINDGEQLKEFQAEIYVSNPKLDIAILRIDQFNSSDLSYLDIEIYFSHEFYNTSCVEMFAANEFEYNGLRGGSIESLDYIKQSFISLNYNDQNEFFAVTCNNVAPGHSGALIRNMQYEIVGMLLQINETKSAAKILKISEILNFLENSNIPITYFKPGCYIGLWQPILLTFSDGFEYSFANLDTINIDSYGFSGAINAQLRIGDSITILHSPCWRTRAACYI